MAYSSDLTSLTIFSLGQITLMDWGNAIVRSKITDSSSNITSITMELHLDGDFRKTKKKVTWLSHSPAASLVEVTLVDYDYLITKKKLEEGDDVKDFVTPVSEFREEAVADGNVKDLKQGDIIQFERKGYYIFDGVSRDRLAFIKIPDGKAAGLGQAHAPSDNAILGFSSTRHENVPDCGSQAGRQCPRIRPLSRSRRSLRWQPP